MMHLDEATVRTGRPRLVRMPLEARTECCVVIPVRDEAERLPQTLHALATQRDMHGTLLDRARYEVVVLANNCSDSSVAVARKVGRLYPTFRLHVVAAEMPATVAFVGFARRLLMDEACDRFFDAGQPRGVIASTDGDSIVAPTWLDATLRCVHAGADAVGGVIAVSAAERFALGATLPFYLDDLAYQAAIAAYEALRDPLEDDPWPRHRCYNGASFAVTAEAYMRCGGIPAIAHHEDQALYRALVRCDARIRHSPDVRVATSARRVARACEGMGARLAQWSLAAVRGELLLAPSVAAVTAHIDARAAARAWWMAPDMSELGEAAAAACGLAVGDLAAIRARYATFGAFWEAIEDSDAARVRLLLDAAYMPARVTTRELCERLAVLRRKAVPDVA